MAKCAKPHNQARVAKKLSRWRELRKVERESKVNVAMVNSVCFFPAELQEVLVEQITPTKTRETGNADESQQKVKSH